VSRLLVRFAKRRTSWESADAVAIRKVEFMTADGAPDLRPSAYDVEPLEVVQIYAEHATAAPIDPPKSTTGVDLAGLAQNVTVVPGKPQFAFLRAQHREVQLSGLAELDALVEQARQALPSRTVDVGRAEVYEYVRSRLAVEDIEWRAAAGAPTAQKWLKKLATRT